MNALCSSEGAFKHCSSTQHKVYPDLPVEPAPAWFFAYLLCRDADLAQDLVQQVLATLAGEDLRAIDNLDAYARRGIVNAYRSKQRRDSLWNRTPELLGAGRPEVVVHDADLRLSLWAAFDLLPARQRAALVMKYFEGLDDAAIAKAVDCELSTVRSLTSRALRRLRPIFEEETHA
jgi:RNA polymerase sigma factor (sigma-70 family)